MSGDEFRKIVRTNGLFLWQVAYEVGISEPTLTRWLRKDLTGDRLKRLMAAVERLLQR